MGFLDSAPQNLEGPIRSYAPASGELLGEVPVCSAEQVSARLRLAREAQRSWAACPVKERVRTLLGFRDLLLTRSDELVDLLSKECGKPRFEALMHEVAVLCDLISYYAHRAPKWLKPQTQMLRRFPHRKVTRHYHPRGVVAILSPWNYPLVIPFGDAVAALMSGNAVVLKPSEATPLIALATEKLLREAGLPPNVLQVVTGFGDTGKALIDGRPDYVVFTGSVATGSIVGSACGSKLIPCTLELGGKAAAIVCEDADPDSAAKQVVYGGLANCGQVCVSVERVYVHEKVHDRFLEAVSRELGKLKHGDPTDPDTELGAIIFPRQKQVADALVDDALTKGATLLAQTSPPNGEGFVPAKVLAHCTPGMKVMSEEIFGPVIPIMKVASEQQAIAHANDSPLGLMGYVLSASARHGARVAEQVEAGTVMVNDMLSAYGCPEAPFGGIKRSGFGRVHGKEGFMEMCEVRAVHADRFTSISNPVSYPYTARKENIAKQLLGFLFRPKHRKQLKG